MKILVISQYFYPEQFRVNDVVSELVKRGHTVTVVTGLPNYPEGEIYEGYEKSYEQLSEYNGATVYRCKLRPRYKGTKNLALNYLSFVVEAKKVLKKLSPDFDIIYVYEISPITLAIPALVYKKRTGTPVYLYCMDIWPECIRDARSGKDIMSKKNLVYIGAKVISRYIYNHVDLIGNKCDGFAAYLHTECNVPMHRMTTLYEHAEDIYLKINDVPEDNHCVDFMFLGNIGSAQLCDVFVRAVRDLKRTTPFKIHFVGEGSETENLKNMVKELGLQDLVLFHGRHPLAEVVRFYQFADCCLLSLTAKTASGITPPGKLFGYMAASRAIVGLISGDSKPLIERAKCGWCVEPDDYDGLLKMMQSIIDGKKDLITAGKNGRNFFLDHFTLERHVTELEKQLSSLCER